MKAPISLKGRALALLAQRDQSRVELRHKLLRHARAEDAARAEEAAATATAAEGAAAEGATRNESDADAAIGAEAATDSDPPSAPARVDALLDWLEAHCLLSQQRFVESRVHARAPRYGNLRIRLELAQHRVALSDEAEQALIDSEFERARAVRARKYPAAPSSLAERAKQQRFLGGRGFSADVVHRVMREAAGAATHPRADPERAAAADPDRAAAADRRCAVADPDRAVTGAADAD